MHLFAPLVVGVLLGNGIANADSKGRGRVKGADDNVSQLLFGASESAVLVAGMVEVAFSGSLPKFGDFTVKIGRPATKVGDSGMLAIALVETFVDCVLVTEFSSFVDGAYVMCFDVHGIFRDSSGKAAMSLSFSSVSFMA